MAVVTVWQNKNWRCELHFHRGYSENYAVECYSTEKPESTELTVRIISGELAIIKATTRRYNAKHKYSKTTTYTRTATDPMLIQKIIINIKRIMHEAHKQIINENMNKIRKGGKTFRKTIHENENEA